MKAKKALGAVLMALGIGGVAWLAHEEYRYLEPGELDERPFPLRGVDVPLMVDQKGVAYSGKLRLRIYVRASGALDHVDAAESTLPAPIVDQVVQAFSAPGWGAGTRNGRARRGVKVVELDFRPDMRDDTGKSFSPER